MPQSDWQSALDQLYGLANWETRPPGTELSFELDRMRRILDRMGNPHRRWPAVHVAGTNGKGSTCAMLERVLRGSGYRVGLYSSPHLHSLRERIQVDGRLISEAAVIRWLEARADIFAGEPAMTTFEALTAMAFEHFAREEVDLAVIEVGLGGRLDTTNVVLPAVSVITPVGMDHAKVLGNSLAAIASDKAGILKPGVPAAIAPQAPESLAAIRVAAAEVGSPLTEVADAWRWDEAEILPFGQRFQLLSRSEAEPRSYRLELHLAGEFQRVNAATAVTALEILAAQGWSAISRAGIVAGLAAARWPARFEIFETGALSPASPAPWLIVDGAHNPPAARVLARALDDRFAARPRTWILGFSRDKDVAALVPELLRPDDRVLLVRAAHPRAMPLDEAAACLKAIGYSASVCASPRAALSQALALTEADGLIVATGSIFAAAELRMAWFELAGLPLPAHDPPLPSR